MAPRFHRQNSWPVTWTAEAFCELSETAGELFRSEFGGSHRARASSSIRINFFPYEVSSISFDFDTEEVVQGGVQVLLGFVREIGQGLQRAVDLSHEGDENRIFFRSGVECV